MNPPGSPGDDASSSSAVRDQVAAVLETIRPGLQRDGGDVELVEVTGEGVVKVRCVGKCICPMSISLLQRGIENALRERVPAVASVVVVRR